MEPADSSKSAEAVAPATESTASSEKQVSSSTSEPTVADSSSNTFLSQIPPKHIFSARSSAGLLCNNLRANPFSVSENSSSSSGILAKPKFSLKPSSFSATGDASSTESNKPDVVSTNPFLRPAKLSYDNDEDSSDGKRDTPVNTEESTQDKSASNNNVEEAKVNSDASKTEAKGTADSTSITPPPIIAPAASALNSNLSRGSQSAFVFGEALDSRVTNVTKENVTNGHSNSEEVQRPKMLTLEEAADEFKKQQESGPILPEVETVTGEEEESNVLQISCKLFFFQDKNKTWAERGRGCLRLNDDTDGGQSRLVMRTAGIHRVILNTNIWPAMICERANLKSIRITGTESGQVHVYLITGSSADIDHLHQAVTYRIQRVKQQTPAVDSSSNVSADDSDASAKRKNTDTEEKSPKKQRQDQSEAATE